MLRCPFHNVVWRPASAVPHTIFASSSLYPIKGFHVLLEAVNLLKRDFPHVQVRVAGSTFSCGGKRRPLRDRISASGYSRHLRDRVRQYALEEHVRPLGTLDAEDFAKELAGSARLRAAFLY